MPAGRGNTCEACYWQTLLDKRVRLDQAAFASPAFAAHFADFGAWLQRHAGGLRAAMHIHRYLPFFTDIEQRYGRIPAYLELLEYFGAEGLRRVRLPMKWLSETHGISVDPVAREADSERRRIQEIIATVPADTVAVIALTTYKSTLQDRISVGKSTIRSMRLALHPAARLLLAADSTGHTLPDQKVLDSVLRDTPGQLAALSGFVRFLNEHYELGLVAVIDASLAAERRRRRQEATLLSLSERGDDSDTFVRKWAEVALAYFHGLSATVSRKLAANAIKVDTDGYRVDVAGQEYWLPTWQSIARGAVAGQPAATS